MREASWKARALRTPVTSSVRARRRSRARALRSARVTPTSATIAAKATPRSMPKSYPLRRSFAQWHHGNGIPTGIPATPFHHDADAVARCRFGREMQSGKTLAVPFCGHVAPARRQQGELQARAIIVADRDDCVGHVFRERRLERGTLAGVEHARSFDDWKR